MPQRHDAPAHGEELQRARRRRVPLDLRGLLISALVAAGVALVLRRIDRGLSG